MKIIITLLALLFLGCQQMPPKTQEEIQQEIMDSVAQCLPQGAYDIHPKGNDWYTFRLKIDEEERQFLWKIKHHFDASTKMTYSRECITELR